MGSNGPRIHAMLCRWPMPAARPARRRRPPGGDRCLHARRWVQGGVPAVAGRAQFGAYRDYGRVVAIFAELAGFDPDSISAIPGLGIA